MMNLRAIRNLSTSTIILTASSVWAQTEATGVAPGAAPSPVSGLLVNLPIFAALFALFYFGIIRPQKKQQNAHAQFVSNLKKGEEVITASGIIGVVSGLTDRIVTLEVDQGTEIKVLRSQVSAYLNVPAGASNGK